MKSASVRAAMLAGVCWLAAVSGAGAQVTTGAVVGTVKDTTDSVVPGAAVTATNLDTGFARTATTDARGEYIIEFVPVGTYRVDAELMGFKRYSQRGVVNPGEDGNSPRNVIDGPGFRNIDMGIYRSFGLGTTRTLQVRIEATNAFNIVNLDNPTATLTSATFGQIRTARAMRQMQLGSRYSF